MLRSREKPPDNTFVPDIVVHVESEYMIEQMDTLLVFRIRNQGENKGHYVVPVMLEQQLGLTTPEQIKALQAFLEEVAKGIHAAQMTPDDLIAADTFDPGVE
jgi:hypothetical protein